MLPQGWVEVDLDTLGKIYCGQSVPTSEVNSSGIGEIYVTGPEQWDGKNIHVNKWTQYPKRLVPDGCVFITVKGAGVGKMFPGIACAIGRDIYAYLPHEFLDLRFIYLSIKNRVAQVIAMARGDIPGLSKGHLTAQPIYLPPLAEQRRIVAKLDSLTARIARARAELERARKNAEHIRIATLGRAFHWNEADLPRGWTRKKIGEIGDVQLGRQRSPKDHVGPHMRPYVRSANITWDGWDLSDVKEMNFSPAEFETFKLQPGDVLLNEGSGSPSEVGKPAIWNDEIKNACFQNTVLRIRSDAFFPELLRYALLFLARTGAFIKNTQGVNIIHIGKAGLSRTCIPVPPISEQPKILKEIQAGFDAANRLQREANRCLTLLNRLESSLLAKAFRGELVPQDPNDEPASVLLDRIRAERAATPKPKRGSRQSTQDMPVPRKRQTEKHG